MNNRNNIRDSIISDIRRKPLAGKINEIGGKSNLCHESKTLKGSLASSPRQMPIFVLLQRGRRLRKGYL